MLLTALLSLKKMVTTEGNCKINLALNVESKRSDGYHSVKMIMQEISLCDTISISFGGKGVRLSCSDCSIPNNEKNIAHRAASAFMDISGIKEGVNIHIEKNIPSQAGLGGGSADGAAVLKCMNAHYGNPLSQKTLLDIALTLGADVPFCIMGGTALAEGIGEILTPVESKIKTPVLIVKPQVGMSTPFAYRWLDDNSFTPVDTDSVLKALESGDLEGLCNSMGNVFEAVAASCAPEVLSIKKELVENGARGAMMSGSGTAVFGIFDDCKKLDDAYAHFVKKYANTYRANMV